AELDDLQVGVGEAELRVEGLEVALDSRRAERVHDHDGLPGAGDLAAGGPAAVQRVQVVRDPVLYRRVTLDPQLGLAFRRGQRSRERLAGKARTGHVRNGANGGLVGRR